MTGHAYESDELMRTRRMVAEQIRARGVVDERVLGVMERVPRGRFVPVERREEAWLDRPVAIGFAQTISQPYIVALMTEKLDVRAEHEVLEVGTGCGYQTAILAQLCRRVYTIEFIEELGRIGRANVAGLGISNVEYMIYDGRQGWPVEREFDRILVAAAAESVPVRLLGQLANGGKMLLPLGLASEQRLVLLEKSGEQIKETMLCHCRFVPLVGG